MPVREAPPLANAFSSVKMITKLVKLEAPGPIVYSPWRSLMFCCGRLPSASRTIPTTTIKMTDPENR